MQQLQKLQQIQKMQQMQKMQQIQQMQKMQQMQQMQQIQQMQQMQQQELMKKQEQEKQEQEKQEQEKQELNKEITDKDISDIVDTITNDENQKDDAISLVSDNSNNFTKSKLLKLNVDKLKNICETNNLSTEGTKGVLIDRILSAEL